MTVITRMTTLAALADVKAERARQQELKEAGRFAYTLDDPGLDDFQRLAVLSEEPGEIARILTTRHGLTEDDVDTSDAALRQELCQVAALAVAWMERL